ncbi:glycoside hydrolase family 28 protein [Mollisia scopiformis]|uniref:Glycoside hydrolase family 28 protein n=1 Tax=Mollisia scopiformis TaxID=149040 RepID=A0A194XPG9_MOLSC|nr:glycoside hydrolase family 28 protein [Mollisia scopiformis]KUJ21632.1 glycoside hydrolase family 28 protein [Mollisia scopiformis]
MLDPRLHSIWIKFFRGSAGISTGRISCPGKLRGIEYRASLIKTCLFQSIVILWRELGAICGADNPRATCIARPQPNSTDDTPVILDAFKQCGQGGNIIFPNKTYHINTVMNTIGLKDCQIDLYGTMLWGTNITYWLANSLPLGYQNQSSAWFLGGTNLTFRGHGHGTLDGNGQTWYDFVNGVSNYPGRPHALTIWNTTDSVLSGLRFVQSQMWTMTIIHSQHVLLEDIYVNSTSHTHSPARNTDGADTMFSSHITFSRWTVANGDDSISLKANSTDISIKDSVFYKGLGVAIGSIGQYKDVFELIENVYVGNVTCVDTAYAAYVKTWTGEQAGYPPNGGGGGLGYARNVTFTNFHMRNSTKKGVFYITQCTTFSGVAGDCNSSLFNVRDVRFENATGLVGTDYVADLQCSAASPGEGIEIKGVDLRDEDDEVVGMYECENVVDTVGFSC